MPDTTDHSETSETNEALGKECAYRARLILENVKWFFDRSISVEIKKDRKANKVTVRLEPLK